MRFVSNILLTWYYIQHWNQMAIFFMDLTNIEGIALNALQCLLKSHLSCLASNIYFVLNSAKVKKLEMWQWRIIWMKGCCLFCASLFTVKVLSKRVWCELSEIYLIAYALWHGLCLVCTLARNWNRKGFAPLIIIANILFVSINFSLEKVLVSFPALLNFKIMSCNFRA